MTSLLGVITGAKDHTSEKDLELSTTVGSKIVHTVLS